VEVAHEITRRAMKSGGNWRAEMAQVRALRGEHVAIPDTTSSIRTVCAACGSRP